MVWYVVLSSSLELRSPILFVFFFLMIRRPPRSTLDRSSAASDVYKRQVWRWVAARQMQVHLATGDVENADHVATTLLNVDWMRVPRDAVSYTHLRAHETVLDLVCRLLLEKKKNNIQ